jgi:hypothetical protein
MSQSKAINTSDFLHAAAQLVVCLQMHPSWPLIERSGEPVAIVLGGYLNSPSLSYSLRTRALFALSALERWTRETAHDGGIAEFSRTDMEDFFASISNTKTRNNHTRALRYVYGVLLESETISASPVREAFPPGQRPNFELPAIITRLGEEATATMALFVEERRQHGLSLTTPKQTVIHLTMIRALASWAEGHHLYDLRDFSVGDGRRYLATLRDERRRQITGTYLRDVFERLADFGALVSNPFPLVKDDQERRERTSSPILTVARRTSVAAEEMIRKFIYINPNEFSLPRLAALNRFASWMAFEKIDRFTQVTRETLLRYRELGLNDFALSSRKSYFKTVARVFRALHQQRTIANDPASEFRHNVNIGYTPRPEFSDISEYLAAKISTTSNNSRMLTVNYSGNFVDLDISSMPFADRLIIARFVNMIDIAERKGNRVINASFIPSNGDNRWILLQQIGAVTKSINNEAWCTPEFIRRYLQDVSLRKWSCDFVERYAANIALYGRNRPATPTTSSNIVNAQCARSTLKY